MRKYDQATIERILKLLESQNQTKASADSVFTPRGPASSDLMENLMKSIPLITFVILVIVILFFMWVLFLMVKKALQPKEVEAVDQKPKELQMAPETRVIVLSNEGRCVVECNHCRSWNALPLEVKLPLTQAGEHRLPGVPQLALSGSPGGYELATGQVSSVLESQSRYKALEHNPSSSSHCDNREPAKKQR